MRSSRIESVVCDAYRDGVPIATDLGVLSGSATDDSSPGVRRKLSIELYPDPGLWDILAPLGTELRPRSVLRYPSGSTETVPLGVFIIDTQSMGYGPGGSISVNGSDKWVKIQRARFLTPTAAGAGLTIRQTIANLIRGALGPGEAVNDLASSTETVGDIVWDRDRDKAIIDLADSIGAYVSFDRDGIATIQDLPTIGADADWTVDASATGILLDASRDRDRAKTYNVVVVAPEKADGTAPFDPVIVWDNDPFSPTYAGFDPTSAGNVPGPLGVVPLFQTSALYNSAVQAEQAGRTILARTTGLAAQLSLSSVRNHALDSLDVVDVLLPADPNAPKTLVTSGGFGGAPFGLAPFGETPPTKTSVTPSQPLERHIVQRVTHPLTPGGEQTIDTRSTRIDEYTE